MPAFLVLEDFKAGRIQLRAGSIIEDNQHDLPRLQAAGLAVTPFQVTMVPVVQAYLSHRASNQGTTEGDLVALLLVAGFLAPPFRRQFDVYDGAGGQTFTPGPITVNLDTVRKDSGGGDFALAADELTVTKAGPYVISYRVGIAQTGLGGSLDGAWGWLERDTGGGFVEIGGSRVASFHRNTADECSAAATMVLDLGAGDALRLRVERQPDGSGSTLAMVADMSGLAIWTP